MERFWIFKRLFIILIISVLLFENSYVKGMDISAKSAVLICADTGSILWGKEENKERPMASTTKIMTALLTLEQAQASDIDVEITDEMVRVEGTSMGLMPGDIVKLESLAKGMLLPSGNDAANAAAITLAGSKENFATVMNEKAKQIGMKNTKFVTPSGLDSGNHHSTAYDMAILGAFAMENELFANIASKKNLKVYNKLLKLYDGCIGIKTGFTKAAGRCLVSCAEKNGVRLVAVTLNAPSDWDDHIKLYNYGFQNTVNKVFDDRGFKISLNVYNGEESGVIGCGATCFDRNFKIGDEAKVERKMEIPEKIEAPIERGQIIGKVVYYLNGKEIGENNIISEQDINKKQVKKNMFNRIMDFIKNIFRK